MGHTLPKGGYEIRWSSVESSVESYSASWNSRNSATFWISHEKLRWREARDETDDRGLSEGELESSFIVMVVSSNTSNNARNGDCSRDCRMAADIGRFSWYQLMSMHSTKSSVTAIPLHSISPTIAFISHPGQETGCAWPSGTNPYRTAFGGQSCPWQQQDSAMKSAHSVCKRYRISRNLKKIAREEVPKRNATEMLRALTVHERSGNNHENV